MRTGLVVIAIGAATAVALCHADSALGALDPEQFCKAMKEIARVGNADAGRWIDRNTRDDGIDVLCDMRTINYKRFIRTVPAPVSGWKQRKEQEWNNIACSSAVLREAIDGGWIITSMITTATGDRVLVIATCK